MQAIITVKATHELRAFNLLKLHTKATLTFDGIKVLDKVKAIEVLTSNLIPYAVQTLER